METIPPLRRRIDRLDDRIVALLARRFALSRRIGRVKAALGGKVRDAKTFTRTFNRSCEK